jgi:hypothetical protein
MRAIVQHDIGSIIEYANASQEDQRDEVAFRYIKNQMGRHIGRSTCERVNCKAVSISWDVRPAAEVDGEAVPPVLRGWRRGIPNDHSFRSLRTESTAFYDVADEELATGEVGLMNETRWAVTELGSCIDFLEDRSMMRNPVMMYGFGGDLVEDTKEE